MQKYKDIKERFSEIEAEYKRKMREMDRTAKEAESKWKNAKLHQLLGDYLTVGYRPKATYRQEPKCDKCDQK